MTGDEKSAWHLLRHVLDLSATPRKNRFPIQSTETNFDQAKCQLLKLAAHCANLPNHGAHSHPHVTTCTGLRQASMGCFQPQLGV